MDNPLTKNIEEGRAPLNFEQYQAAGGYTSIKKALDMAPRDIIELVKEAMVHLDQVA